MKNAVATAIFNGNLYYPFQQAWLVPFKTTRRGQRTVAYRWQTARGDSPSQGYQDANRLMVMATRGVSSIYFSEVKALPASDRAQQAGLAAVTLALGL